MAVSWIYSVDSLGALRNDFDGFGGVAFTLGLFDIYVHKLGKYVPSEPNTQIHTVKIVDANTLEDVAMASVDLAGAQQGTFVYTPITPVRLAAQGSYFLLSEEFDGGDQWLNATGTLVTVTVGTATSAVYFYTGEYRLIESSGSSYGVADFEWQLAAESGTSGGGLLVGGSLARA